MLNKVKVLFADKSQNMLKEFANAAEQAGWVGDYVSSVSGIIDKVNCDCPNYDAIISGFNFIQDGERLTAITAARQIRKIQPSVPILFVTSYINSMTREEARRVSADLIEKPVNIPFLIERTNELVSWYRDTILPYKGLDRRKRSLNLTTNSRRSTDVRISVPDVLSHAVE